MFEQFKESLLTVSRNRLYFGFAFDGTKYYLTSSDKQVLILDDTYVQIGSLTASRFYYAVCFDPVSDCFWAMAIGCPGILFCLSDDFQEIRRIRLVSYSENFNSIGGLSYDACNDRLLFIGGKKIYATDRKGNISLLMDLRGRENTILSVGAVPEGLLYLAVRQNRSYLVSVSYPDGKVLKKHAFSDDFQARTLLIQKEKNHSNAAELCILGTKRGYLPCLYEYRLNGQTACPDPVCSEICRPEPPCCDACRPEPPCCDTCHPEPPCCDACRPEPPCCDVCHPEPPCKPAASEPNGSICSNHSSTADSNLINFLFGGLLSELMRPQTAQKRPQPCGEPPCRPGRPPQPCCPPCCPEEPCQDSCHPCFPNPDCCCPCKPCPPCDCGSGCHSKCCCHAYSDTLESIALAEASIAHILNAEGEKLQKVIAGNYGFPELIKVNESVQSTIINATYLEQVLTTKLEALLRKPCCCNCHIKPCCEQRHEEEAFMCGPDLASGIEEIFSAFMGAKPDDSEE